MRLVVGWLIALSLCGAAFLVLWGLAGTVTHGCDWGYQASRARRFCGVPHDDKGGFFALWGGVLLGWGTLMTLQAWVKRAGSWWPAFGVTAGAVMSVMVVGSGGASKGLTIIVCAGPVLAAVVPVGAYWFSIWSSRERA
ncbi:hypothetical protein Airi02_074980 [Actinoallomurus iriomotensis]|uniref:Transmembrane protein n=2 Tax=Actinoallomurus iriomotensis TaxID=478107 RepID=A0A9W6S8Z6_9ACTN|nr:hypothetical protein Airi02_074980 [Actinoallomurus iriomotensis]